MVKRTKRRLAQATLLIIAEGPIDKAFLEHLKDLYDSRHSGQRIKIEAGDGGSPRDVIKKALGWQQVEYDKKYVLIDEDVTLSASDRKLAKDNKIQILQSTPVCLEGMILRALKQRAPDTNKACKSVLHPMLTGKPNSKSSYKAVLTKEIFDECEDDVIQTLIRIMKNKH
jgi:hypothetical protein